MQEEWRAVVGYEGRYEVSNTGKVKGLFYKKYKILKANTDKDGYRNVFLYKNTKQKAYKIHRLVAITFIKNTTNKEQINHIDFNKSNNNVSNLEWCTPKENMKHYHNKKTLLCE